MTDPVLTGLQALTVLMTHPSKSYLSTASHREAKTLGLKYLTAAYAVTPEGATVTVRLVPYQGRPSVLTKPATLPLPTHRGQGLFQSLLEALTETHDAYLRSRVPESAVEALAGSYGT